jgi:signal transduction histidine kinase
MVCALHTLPPMQTDHVTELGSMRMNRRVAVSEVVEEVAVEAAVDAEAGGFGLAVAPVEGGVYVEADLQVLAAALTKLVHNAFKHSHTHGHVSLTTIATADHVLIEVEDECGGLPPGEAEELLRPLEERSIDQPHPGFGLAISRLCVEAMGGEMRVRDLPGKGCVFTVDLPRQAPP